MGWDQPAASADELATFRYAMFVDGNRFEMSAVSCAASPSAAGFACSGALPPMAAGAHTLQMSAFTIRDGQTIEGDRSPAFNVVVMGSSSAEKAVALAPGAVVPISGGAPLRVARVVGGLERPTDIAVAPDGRVFVAEAKGRISIVEGGQRRTALEPVPGSDVSIVALALDPQFSRTGLVYVVRALVSGAAPVFQIVRYREVGGTLGEAATLLDHLPASSARPAAALRFGPDGRLYAAFEERSDLLPTEAAFNGKILRLNPDGTTPRDQRGGSPVLAAGVRRPRGIVWNGNGDRWIVDGDVRAERLIGAGAGATADAAPVPASYTLPVPFGAAAAAFHPAGDLLIAAETAGYVLRVRFDPANRMRVLTTERLLEGNVDAVRAIAVAPGGSVYVGTNSTLMVLAPR